MLINAKLFVGSFTRPCVDYLQKYIDGHNQEYPEIEKPVERVEVDVDNIDLIFSRNTAGNDGDIMSARAEGFRDGWQACLIFMGQMKKESADSNFVTRIFSK